MTELRTAEAAEVAPVKSVDDQLIDELVGRAQADDPQLTGDGGLLQQLTKRLLESALKGEITDRLGYDKHVRRARWRQLPQRKGGETVLRSVRRM
ncbi:hypothetical protein ACFWJW_27160 [Streptomyces sp. NPDC127097]|uniref:hypothetical protein n=1 Tax=Streptomyces sp. NPDC127097 TaxID=3347136 RepID=UPI00366239A8